MKLLTRGSRFAGSKFKVDGLIKSRLRDGEVIPRGAGPYARRACFDSAQSRATRDHPERTRDHPERARGHPERSRRAKGQHSRWLPISSFGPAEGGTFYDAIKIDDVGCASCDGGKTLRAKPALISHISHLMSEVLNLEL